MEEHKLEGWPAGLPRGRNLYLGASWFNANVLDWRAASFNPVRFAVAVSSAAQTVSRAAVATAVPLTLKIQIAVTCGPLDLLDLLKEDFVTRIESASRTRCPRNASSSGHRR